MRYDNEIMNTKEAKHIYLEGEYHIERNTSGKKKDYYLIRKSTSTKAKVEGIREQHEVDIKHMECTCGFWQIIGLLCIHMITFIETKQHVL